MDYRKFFVENQALCGFILDRLEYAMLKRYASSGEFSEEFIAATSRRFKVNASVVRESWEKAKRKLKQRVVLRDYDNELWLLPISGRKLLDTLTFAGLRQIDQLRDRRSLLAIKGIGPDKADEIAAALRIWDEKFAPLPEPPPTAVAAELQPALSI